MTRRGRQAVSRLGGRYLVACLVLALATGTATGQAGWSVGPSVAVPAVRYSVIGARPDCSGRDIVAQEVRRVTEGFGLRTPDPATEPAPLSRAIGGFLDRLGLDAMNQDFAECREVCTAIPLTATRVTSLVGYVTLVGSSRFVAMPFNRYMYYVHWEPDVDTTRVTSSARLVCAGIRNWGQSERQAFLVVGYE